MTTFENVVEFNQSNRDTNISAIKVRIGLKSGNIVSGEPIQIDTRKQGVLHSAEGGIIVLDQSAIEFIEVLNPENIMEKLTDGSFFEIPMDKEVSKLNLKKILKDHDQILSARYGISLDAVSDELMNSPKHRYQLKILIEAIVKAFSKISGDSLGLEAVKHIKQLRVLSSENDLLITKETNHDFLLSLNLSRRLPNQLEELIKERIENLL